jgi:uncharacterized protein with PIN domain
MPDRPRPPSGCYLLRFAESGRDGQPGRQGLRRDLVEVIERELPGARARVIGSGRIAVECDGDAAGTLAGMPGVTSFSPCRRVALGDVERAAVELARERLPAGGRFAVRVKRVGQHAFRSRELAAALGHAIGQALPGARVDLAAPDLTVGVEVRGGDCFLYADAVAGADRRPGPAAPAGEPRFLADQMLGRLAVWLRLCGFDTAGARDRPDSWLLRRARDDGRVLLTQDRALSRAGSAATYYVEARDLDGQLGEVIRAFGLGFDRSRLLRRCTRCNQPVEAVAPEAVADRVPPAVRELGRELYLCPSCGRVYWEGDHCQRILARLAAFFPALA